MNKTRALAAALLTIVGGYLSVSLGYLAGGGPRTVRGPSTTSGVRWRVRMVRMRGVSGSRFVAEVRDPDRRWQLFASPENVVRYFPNLVGAEVDLMNRLESGQWMAAIEPYSGVLI